MSAQNRGNGALARAVVHAGGVETAYLRAGGGEVVVLVTAGLERDDVLQIVQTLSRQFLVLAAAPTHVAPHGTAGLSRWLREFLECLGVAEAHLFLHASVSAILTGEQVHA
jgi:hypothetical protein